MSDDNNKDSEKTSSDKEEIYDTEWDDWYDESELINKKYKLKRLNKRLSKYRE